MAFGGDGFLYITTGDGSSDSDTWNSGQTLDDRLQPFRVQPPDAAEHLVEKAGFSCNH